MRSFVRMSRKSSGLGKFKSKPHTGTLLLRSAAWEIKVRVTQRNERIALCTLKFRMMEALLYVYSRTYQLIQFNLIACLIYYLGGLASLLTWCAQ